MELTRTAEIFPPWKAEGGERHSLGSARQCKFSCFAGEEGLGGNRINLKADILGCVAAHESECSPLKISLCRRNEKNKKRGWRYAGVTNAL